ncbi:MAG: division/cell wall cluster transcriptional repressor MraZ [Firmicutes bacterium]|nr:division/cell wall cluster transcriptional repressor MraZ [Bacillota bacterium]
MLFGEYYHQVDAKSRVRIPPKFKDALGTVVITQGSDGALFLFSAPEFKLQLEKKMYATDLFDSDGNKHLRTIFSSAFELEEDAQGRCLLPKTLREKAKIDKDIVFVGVGNRVELWAKEEWERYNGG